MRSGLLSVLLTLSLLTAGATPASALSTYFGQDLGTGPGSFTTSMSAEQDFHDALGAGNFDTEGFESFADKDAGPLSVFQGGLSVSGILSDTVPDAGKVRVAPLDDEVNRGFQTDGDNFYKNETTSDPSAQLFNIMFSEGVRSFGFYASAWSTDASPTADPATVLVLDLWADSNQTTLLDSIEIPHSHDDIPGSVFYFGVIADSPFLSVSLRNDSVADPGDRIGFDGLTVAVVPEPSTALMLGAGLLGIALSGRRRSA